MNKMYCKECPLPPSRTKVKMKLQLRSEKGEGVYWCPECGAICKTIIIAKDPINEKIIAWETPTWEEIY